MLQPDSICHYARKQQIEKNSLTQKKARQTNKKTTQTEIFTLFAEMFCGIDLKLSTCRS